MKDSRNVYELLNHLDSNLDTYDKMALSDLEKQKLKKNFRKRGKSKFNLKKLGTLAAVAVICLGLLSQTSFGQYAHATAQSKVAEISYSIGRALGVERNIEPYANVVNQTVENNGVEVKLTDVIVDKDELLFCAIVDAGIPVDGFNFDYDIFINGKILWNFGATGSAGKIDDSETAHFATYAVDAKGIDMTDTVDMKIILKNMYSHTGVDQNKIKGKWEFAFSANGSELMANSYTVPLDYIFNIDGQRYRLNEFRYNPLNQKIFGELSGKTKDSYAIDLKGHDNLGNEVTFFLTSVSGEDLVFKYENLYRDLADNATSVTLTPFAAKYPEKSGKMSNDYAQVGEEFTITLKK